MVGDLLGEGEPHAISAIHGLGVGDLLDVVVSLLPEYEPETEPEVPRLAIVGRPNVGKSTLLNRLLGAERAVVRATRCRHQAIMPSPSTKQAKANPLRW